MPRVEFMISHRLLSGEIINFVVGLYYGYIMVTGIQRRLAFVTMSNNETQIVVSEKVLTNMQASTFINETK